MPPRFRERLLFAADGPTGPGGMSANLAATPVAGAMETAVAAEPKPRLSRRILIAGIALLALLGAGRYGYDYVTAGWYRISTDDAYIKADVATVSAKVGGFIIEFPVAENSVVAPDTVIAQIDDGDYKLALDTATRRVETQRVTVARFDSQILQADAAIQQARDQIVAATADVKRTESDLARYTKLTKEIGVTAQRLDQAQADRDRTRANVASANSGLAGAVAAKAVLMAQKKEAEGTLSELQVQVDKAKRDLSFTKVRAAVGGVFGNKGASVGTLVQPGTRLGALIADGSLYVEANFKETQLRDLHPGQAATVTVDAMGGATLKGTIESFAPGSGALFSLLPPENATGNFTKIVQRFPIRIALPADERTVKVLRPGMSVVVTIDTRAQASGGSSLAALR